MTVLKQMSWYTTGNITTLFCQWIIIMLIPKITNFSDAGIFAVAISVASIINQIATFSLNTYQVADRYEKFNQNSYAITRLTTIAISFICIVPIVIVFDYNLEQILIIIAYSIYRNLINYAYLHISSLQLEGHLEIAGKAMTIEGIASILSFISTYIITSNLLISTTVMAVIGGGLFVILMVHHHTRITGKTFKPDLNNHSQVRSMLIIGFPLLVSTLAPIIITALPKLILENNWGTEIVGIFSTLTAPTIVVPTVITSIFAPLVVHFSLICKSGDIKRLRVQYTKVLLLIIMTSILGFVISFVSSNLIFELIYGSEISPYTHFFDILIIGIFAYSIGICSITILITKDQGKIAGFSATISCIISTVIFLVTIPNEGMDGAVWGLLAAYIIFGLSETVCAYLPFNK